MRMQRAAAPRRSSGNAHPLDVDRWLQERAPSPVVSDVLRCVWSGDLGEMAVPIPDECVDIIWVAGQLWVCGPESQRRPVRTAPGSPAVGVRFRPGHGPRVLQVGGAELTDVCVPVTALDRGVRVQSVLQRAAHRGVVDVHALETLVAKLACDAWPVDPVAAELGVRICRGTLPLHKIVVAMGRSERDLRRRSRSAFGYAPATLARIVRLHRALGLARRSPRGLAELAVAAGYTDQPHMNHDVRALTGTTPGRLLRSSSSPTEPAAD